MEPKVWGIGLGRTGTKSLTAALKILGYKNSIHNPGTFEELREVDSATEAGAQCFYQYLDARFPGSKFVLTTRELRSWLESNKKAFSKYPIDRFDESSPYYDAMIRNRMARWNSLEYDEPKIIERYFSHHLEVVRHFQDRPEQLLIMNIVNGDGWDELCGFLELPVPDVPFPHIKD